jgi:4-amino-4-deoxy-L-arabinose transferase-like glycosyltransferase
MKGYFLSMQSRSLKILVLFVVPVLIYLLPLSFIPLMEPDEGRYSSIPNEMNISGDYITPRLKGVVYFEKPPLSYWATAISFKLFGKNEFSSRLFVALTAWGCIILAYRMGLYFYGPRTGLYSAAILATSLFHAAIGRINILDMPLGFFICMAIWSGFRFLQGDEKAKRWLYLLYLFSALAFLTKGLIGIVFPFGVIIVWLFFSGRFRDMLRVVSPIGMLVFAAVAFPWLILVQRENPDFFRFFFIQEHLLRYTTKIHHRYQPFYFYIPILIAGMLPWIAWLPEAVKGARDGYIFFKKGEKSILLTWILLIFIFFSLSSSKLIPYLTPIFPPLAVIFGIIFSRFEERTDAGAPLPGGRFRIVGVVVSLLFLTAIAVPLFIDRHGVKPAEWLPLILLPAHMMMFVSFLPDRMQRYGTGRRFLTLCLLFTVFFASLTPPMVHFLAPYKSARPLSQAMDRLIPREVDVYQYGMSLYGVDFYTGRRTPIVDDIGELAYGVSHMASKEERDRYFLYSDAFFRLAKAKGGLYCATENNEKLERLQKEFPAARTLWQSGSYSLLQLNNS